MAKIENSVVIVGRRWFDRVNGNTYHTAQIFVDGVDVGKTDFEYGYGEHYVHTATTWLEKQGYLTLKRHSSGGREFLRDYCREHNIACGCVVTDVARKRDL